MKKLFIKYREPIVYVFFGALTTAVSAVSYIVCIKLINLQNEIAEIAVANAISWVCAMLFAFTTNKIWVFKSKSRDVKTILNEFWKFVVSRILTGVLEWFGVPFLVYLGLNQTVFGIEGSISKIIVNVLVVILNYVFSKLIVFKKKK